MTRKIKMIDVPGGWRFGFPREFTMPPEGNVKEWVIECGYPRQIIDDLGIHFRPTFWEEDVDEVDPEINE